MHIVNIMFSRGGGGIEQAFVDYCVGLSERGHKVTAIVYPGAVAEDLLQQTYAAVDIIPMKNWSEWDIFAMFRLRKILSQIAPDCIIAHANRAYSLAEKAIKGKFPLVAVAQNYSTRRFTDADAVFTTTHDLISHLVQQGVTEERVFHIPNMIRCTELPHRPVRRDPPIIGTMGRFVTKKGFDTYIAALEILKNRGYEFKAILGGSGDEEAKLKEQARTSGLTDILSFPGWVQDKKAFYTGIDIFCLPSLHEPFGIVLLEAFTYGAAVVSTDSEGPRDIITPNYDALMIEKANPEALANSLEQLLRDPALADKLAANAFAKTKTRYTIEVVCERVEQAVQKILISQMAANTRKAA
jgi:glycosyltransferase involved in cell wall biosynthesis